MHTIVNIRGTSGSGKSTVARRIMLLLEEKHVDVQERGMIGGKERILGHQVGPVFFLGKYATDCGGVDSMSWKGAADDICDLVHHKAMHGPVVFEGLMASSWGTGRLLDLWERCEKKLHVIMLTTPLEVCLASVQARRDAKYKAKGEVAPPLNPANTTSKYHSSLKGAQNLQARGMTTIEYLDRDAALARALELLT